MVVKDISEVLREERKVQDPNHFIIKVKHQGVMFHVTDICINALDELVIDTDDE